MVSLSALAIVSSVVVGQAGVPNKMPAELQEQIETRIVGDWVVEGTYGDKKFIGVEAWRWTAGKTSLIVEGQTTMDGTINRYTYIAGWDSGKNALVLTGYGTGGDSAMICWNEITPRRWSGQITGVFQGATFESPARLDFLEDSIRYEDTTLGKRWASVARRSVSGAENEGRKAFEAFAALAVGGTWVATADGQRFEDTYELILDGKFMLLSAKGAGEFPAGMTILGVDPITNKLTSWGFNANGVVSIGTSQLVSDGVWIGEWKGTGPSGRGSDTSRLTKVDADTVKYESLEQKVSGDVKPFPEVTIWTRRR